MAMKSAILASMLSLAQLTGTSAIAMVNRRSVQNSNMQPEVVARTLAEVEDKWKSEAAAFVECSANNGTAHGPCAGLKGAFMKSCTTIMNVVMKASSGDRSVVKEYMNEVCGQEVLQDMRKDSCIGFATALIEGMTDDKYTNREDLNLNGACGNVWQLVTVVEEKRVAKEAEDKAIQAKEEAERQEAEIKAEATRRAAEAKEEAERQEAQRKAEEKAAAEHKVAEEKADIERKAVEKAEAGRKAAEKVKKAAEEAKEKTAEGEKKTKAEIKKVDAAKGQSVAAHKNATQVKNDSKIKPDKKTSVTASEHSAVVNEKVAAASRGNAVVASNRLAGGRTTSTQNSASHKSHPALTPKANSSPKVDSRKANAMKH